MMLTLKNPTIQKLIDDRVSSGQYASAEDVFREIDDLKISAGGCNK